MPDDQHPRILVVDDDRGIRNLLRRWLEDAGYVVTVADNGNQALYELEKGHQDVLITDISMPDMDGYELLRTIRSRHGSLKVIAVSGFMAGTTSFIAEKLGAAAFLNKPFTSEEVLASVRRVLASP